MYVAKSIHTFQIMPMTNIEQLRKMTTPVMYNPVPHLRNRLSVQLMPSAMQDVIFPLLVLLLEIWVGLLLLLAPSLWKKTFHMCQKSVRLRMTLCVMCLVLNCSCGAATSSVNGTNSAPESLTNTDLFRTRTQSSSFAESLFPSETFGNLKTVSLYTKRRTATDFTESSVSTTDDLINIASIDVILSGQSSRVIFQSVVSAKGIAVTHSSKTVDSSSTMEPMILSQHVRSSTAMEPMILSQHVSSSIAMPMVTSAIVPLVDTSATLLVVTSDIIQLVHSSAPVPTATSDISLPVDSAATVPLATSSVSNLVDASATLPKATSDIIQLVDSSAMVQMVTSNIRYLIESSETLVTISSDISLLADSTGKSAVIASNIGQLVDSSSTMSIETADISLLVDHSITVPMVSSDIDLPSESLVTGTVISDIIQLADSSATLENGFSDIDQVVGSSASLQMLLSDIDQPFDSSASVQLVTSNINQPVESLASVSWVTADTSELVEGSATVSMLSGSSISVPAVPSGISLPIESASAMTLVTSDKRHLIDSSAIMSIFTSDINLLVDSSMTVQMIHSDVSPLVDSTTIVPMVQSNISLTVDNSATLPMVQSDISLTVDNLATLPMVQSDISLTVDNSATLPVVQSDIGLLVDGSTTVSVETPGMSQLVDSSATPLIITTDVNQLADSLALFATLNTRHLFESKPGPTTASINSFTMISGYTENFYETSSNGWYFLLSDTSEEIISLGQSTADIISVTSEKYFTDASLRISSQILMETVVGSLNSETVSSVKSSAGASLQPAISTFHLPVESSHSLKLYFGSYITMQSIKQVSTTSPLEYESEFPSKTSKLDFQTLHVDPQMSLLPLLSNSLLGFAITSSAKLFTPGAPASTLPYSMLVFATTVAAQSSSGTMYQTLDPSAVYDGGTKLAIMRVPQSTVETPPLQNEPETLSHSTIIQTSAVFSNRKVNSEFLQWTRHATNKVESQSFATDSSALFSGNQRMFLSSETDKPIKSESIQQTVFASGVSEKFLLHPSNTTDMMSSFSASLASWIVYNTNTGDYVIPSEEVSSSTVFPGGTESNLTSSSNVDIVDVNDAFYSSHIGTVDTSFGVSHPVSSVEDASSKLETVQVLEVFTSSMDFSVFGNSFGESPFQTYLFYPQGTSPYFTEETTSYPFASDVPTMGQEKQSMSFSDIRSPSIKSVLQSESTASNAFWQTSVLGLDLNLKQSLAPNESSFSELPLAPSESSFSELPLAPSENSFSELQLAPSESSFSELPLEVESTVSNYFPPSDALVTAYVSTEHIYLSTETVTLSGTAAADVPATSMYVDSVSANAVNILNSDSLMLSFLETPLTVSEYETEYSSTYEDINSSNFVISAIPTTDSGFMTPADTFRIKSSVGLAESSSIVYESLLDVLITDTVSTAHTSVFAPDTGTTLFSTEINDRMSASGSIIGNAAISSASRSFFTLGTFFFVKQYIKFVLKLNLILC